MDIDSVIEKFETPKEFRITGNLIINGNPIEGAWTTTCGTDCLVSLNVLKELLRTKEECIRLHKFQSHWQKQIMEGASFRKDSPADKKELEQARVRIKELENSLADAGVVIESLKKELEAAKEQSMAEARALSADVRAKKRDRGGALALSLSMRGYGNKKIVQELSSGGYGFSKSSIARALSVTKDGDKQRIKDIMALHPDYFEGISEQDFEKWFSERYEKLTETARKKASNL